MKRDSNPRPSGPKPDALPDCAIHRLVQNFLSRYVFLVRRGGLEPPRLKTLTPEASASTNSATLAGHDSKSGVADGIRTHDNRNHNPGLYQLSYSHQKYAKSLGAPDRI